MDKEQVPLGYYLALKYLSETITYNQLDQYLGCIDIVDNQFERLPDKLELLVEVMPQLELVKA